MSKQKKPSTTYIGQSMQILSKRFKLFFILFIIFLVINTILVTQDNIDNKTKQEYDVSISINRKKEYHTMGDDIDNYNKWNGAISPNSGDLTETKGDNGLYDMSDAIQIAYGSLTEKELLYIKDFYDMCVSMTDKANNKCTSETKLPKWWLFGINAAECTNEMSKDKTVPLVVTDLHVDTYGDVIPNGKSVTFKDMIWSDRGVPENLYGGNGNKYHRNAGDTANGDYSLGTFQANADTIKYDGNGDGLMGSPWNDYDAALSVAMRAVTTCLNTRLSQNEYKGLSDNAKHLTMSAIHNRGGGGFDEIWNKSTVSSWKDDIEDMVSNQNLLDEYVESGYSPAILAKFLINEKGWKYTKSFSRSCRGDKLFNKNNIIPEFNFKNKDLAKYNLTNMICKMDSNGNKIAYTDYANFRQWGLITLKGKYIYGVYTYILGKELGGSYGNQNQGTMGINKYKYAGKPSPVCYYGEYDFLQRGTEGLISNTLSRASINLVDGKFDRNDFNYAYNKQKGQADFRAYEGKFREIGWHGNCPILAQTSSNSSGRHTFLFQNQRKTMAKAACSVYTLTSMLHTVGLGQTEIPKPNVVIGSYKGNGLNKEGYLDVCEVASAINGPVTYSQVEKLGYEVKVLPTSTDSQLNAIFKEVQNGYPYAVNIYNNGRQNLDYYDIDTMKKLGNRNICTGGHFVLLVNAYEYNKEMYFEIADSCGVKITNNSKVDTARYCYKVSDFVKNKPIRPNGAYTVLGVKGQKKSNNSNGYVNDSQELYTYMKNNGGKVDRKVTVSLVNDGYFVYINDNVFLKFEGRCSVKNGIYEKGTVISNNITLPKLGKKDISTGSISLSDLYPNGHVNDIKD